MPVRNARRSPAYHQLAMRFSPESQSPKREACLGGIGAPIIHTHMNNRPAPRWLSRFALLVVATAFSRPAPAATLHVPTQHSTVRAAASSAASGDTILIAPGVHPGGVHIKGKSLTLASWFILSGDSTYITATVIDSVVGAPCDSGGCAGNAVLEFAASAGGSSIIGLTIRHGEDGVRAYSVVNIAFCRLIANADGIDYQSGSGGLIRNSVFAQNTDDGIDINGRTNVRVIGNAIRNNHQDGIEFRLYPYAGPLLTVEFIGNIITHNGGDGIQLIDYPDASNRVIRIEHNLFSGNLDAAVGCMPDGITSEDFSGAPIAERIYLINNTFHDEHYGFVGGANLISLNNIFEGVSATALRRAGGNSIASYSLFWENGVNYEDSNIDHPHIMRDDPRENSDGTLSAASPAIDAGTAYFEWAGETVLNLPPGAYLGDAPDLGAFEYGGRLPDGNCAPVVSAGPDRTVTLNVPIVLDGTATDDWLPMPWALTADWSVVSGPGPVAFHTPGRTDTGVSFAVEGSYMLRLAVSDGTLTATDPVHVTVLPAPPQGPMNFDRRVASPSDDQEETSTGTISPNTGDLELVLGPTVQKVGLRFTGVALPPGAMVTRAYIQFEADEIQSGATQLLIHGQAADDPVTFATTNFDISSRPRTGASASWSPPPWLSIGAQGADQRTPDLRALIQEIVDRPGWASGNAMAFIITGSGHRTARSFEGDSLGAASLHIEANASVTAVGDPRPVALALHRVSPNPSRGALRLDLSIGAGGAASIELVDLAGRRVATRNLGSFPAGNHSVELRESLPSGVYLVRLVQGGRARVMKAVVLR